MAVCTFIYFYLTINDHTGGVRKIVARHQESPVYGPKETEVLVNHVVEAGYSINLLDQKPFESPKREVIRMAISTF